MSAVLDIEALEAQVSKSLLDSMREAAGAKKWFDVTSLNPLNKLFDDTAESAARKTREFRLLQKLHTVNFEAMPPEVREAIPALFEAVIEAARANFAGRQAVQS